MITVYVDSEKPPRFRQADPGDEEQTGTLTLS